MEHFHVEFGDPRCIGFRDIVQRQTDRQTNGVKNPTPATAAGVGKYPGLTHGSAVTRNTDSLYLSSIKLADL